MIYFIIFIIVMVFMALTVAKQQKKPKSQRSAIKSKRILTMHEQPTFIRLQQALPDCIVLTQVAFSAFMTTSGYATRNLFNRKVADFVVLDQQFNIIAIVELDDASHQHKQQQDADRDALIAEAGYRVIRYRRTPDFDQLRQDFAPLMSSTMNPVKPTASQQILADTTTAPQTQIPANFNVEAVAKHDTAKPL